MTEKGHSRPPPSARPHHRLGNCKGPSNIGSGFGLGPRSVLALVSFILLPLATIIFAIGFFPYKPYLKGISEYALPLDNRATAQFDRVMLMVVDSLRSDYVFATSSGMTFTQRLIQSGNAFPFTARASAPTVTMPKIKAITTGSVPSYLDVILNIAESDSSSSLKDQDSWLLQLHRRGLILDGGDSENGKIVFYGDETWIKLFPGLFSRQDGTTSFFVSDFTEVDTNVTRHLDRELAETDWSAFIVHYLGLDHIGHKSGSTSVHMRPKQEEMDGVVEKIYRAVEERESGANDANVGSTLIVLLGDHGMTDEGNHGGSSPGETSPALVFASPKLAALESTSISGGAPRHICPTEPSHDYVFYNQVDQSDLVPTLSALLGLPIPMNNLGVMIEDFLPLWGDERERLYIVQENALQMLKIVKAKYPDQLYLSMDGEMRREGEERKDCSRGFSDDGGLLACLWHRAIESESHGASVTTTELLDEYLHFCREAKRILSRASSDYKTDWMFGGLGIGVVACGLAALGAVNLITTSYSSPSPSPSPSSSLLDSVTWVILVGLHLATSFASSYVEMENLFWSFMAATALSLVALGRFDSGRKGRSGPWGWVAGVAALGLHRIAGDWAIRDSFVYKHIVQSPAILWLCVIGTLISSGLMLIDKDARAGPLSPSVLMLSFIPLTAALVFKLAWCTHDAPELLGSVNQTIATFLRAVPLVLCARFAFGLWALSVGILICGPLLLSLSTEKVGGITSTTDRSRVKWSVTFVLLMQMRLENVPLIGIWALQERLLTSLSLHEHPFHLGSIILALAQSSFFQAGGSNSISTIDLSQAYNGLSGFSPLFVGILLFTGNWAGPIWWATAAERMARDGATGESTDRKQDPAPLVSNSDLNFALQTCAASISLTGVMAASYHMRDHLFVWSVFSPEFLYAATWTVGYHALVVGLFGRMVGWMMDM